MSRAFQIIVLVSMCLPLSCGGGMPVGSLQIREAGSESAVDSGDEIFALDDHTLARFEFIDDNVRDSSGKGRDAQLIGGAFMDSAWGRGLVLMGGHTQGLDWSAFAHELKPPLTIEVVVTPRKTQCYGKLVGFDDGHDNGFYYCDGVVSYPSAVVGAPVIPHERHYLAFVIVSETHLEVYINGENVGVTDTNTVFPLSEVLFFQDDRHTSRKESMPGLVDAIRISKTARSHEEISEIEQRLLLREAIADPMKEPLRGP